MMTWNTRRQAIRHGTLHSQGDAHDQDLTHLPLSFPIKINKCLSIYSVWNWKATKFDTQQKRKQNDPNLSRLTMSFYWSISSFVTYRTVWHSDPGSQSHVIAASPSAASMVRNASEKDMGNGNGDVRKVRINFSHWTSCRVPSGGWIIYQHLSNPSGQYVFSQENPAGRGGFQRLGGRSRLSRETRLCLHPSHPAGRPGRFNWSSSPDSLRFHPSRPSG